MKFIHFAILLLLAVLASSCGKEKHYLTDVDKQMIPYQVGDTIYGKDQWGKQKMFTVRNIEMIWSTYGYNDYLWEQVQKTHVQTEQADFSFSLVISAWNQGSDIKPLRIVSNIVYPSMLYDKNGKFVENVYDSLQINDKIYYDVVSAELANNSHQAYYNKTYGVLQIKEYGKTVFTLDTVIFADKR